VREITSTLSGLRRPPQVSSFQKAVTTSVAFRRRSSRALKTCAWVHSIGILRGRVPRNVSRAQVVHGDTARSDRVEA